MKTFLRSLINGASAMMPLDALIKASGQNMFLPFYHIISDNSVPHIRHLYAIRSVKQFELDLDQLLRHFEPVDMNFVRENLHSGQRTKKKIFHLSFDDGLREIYDVIAPVLLKKSIPATFFVNPDFINNKKLFYRYQVSVLIERMETLKLTPAETAKITQLLQTSPAGQENIKKALLQINYVNKDILQQVSEMLQIDFNAYLEENKPYLSLAQCRELRKQGFEFGGHSMDHPLYSSIPLQEQIRQTRDSVGWVLQNQLSLYKYFAFPFTDHNVSQSFFDTIYNPENPMADLSFGCAGLKQNDPPFHSQRTALENASRQAKQTMSAEYLYYLLKIPFGRNRIHRA